MSAALRSPAFALLALLLAWLAWEAAGWLVARFGLPLAETLQQAGLLLLALGLADRLFPAEPPGDSHG